MNFFSAIVLVSYARRYKSREEEKQRKERERKIFIASR